LTLFSGQERFKRYVLHRPQMSVLEKRQLRSLDSPRRCRSGSHPDIDRQLGHFMGFLTQTAINMASGGLSIQVEDVR
jgi:hypothetical protein